MPTILVFKVFWNSQKISLALAFHVLPENKATRFDWLIVTYQLALEEEE